MAKIVKRSNFFKRKKKWEHFKMSFKRFLLKVSILTNITLLLYIYYPAEFKILTNNCEMLYKKVAPIVESLIKQLPL